MKKSVDKPHCGCYNTKAIEHSNRIWGYSSAGRALEWHSRGQRFDPAYLHHRSLENHWFSRLFSFDLQPKVSPAHLVPELCQNCLFVGCTPLLCCRFRASRLFRILIIPYVALHFKHYSSFSENFLSPSIRLPPTS